MAIAPTYPGVYIEEIPSGVRTITGVSTSVTAFLGSAKRGPINKAVHLLSYADFERRFGGLSPDSELTYAVRQFFLNGGAEAWVVRLAKNPQPATRTLQRADGQDVLTLNALDEGASGNGIEVRVDYQTARPNSSFNMSLTFVDPDNPASSSSETFADLSMNRQDARFALDVVNGVSQLVTLESKVTGAMIGALGKGTSQSADLVDGGGNPVDVAALIDPGHSQMLVSVNGLPPVPVQLAAADATGANANAKLTSLCAAIQAKVRAQTAGNTALSQFTCARQGTSILLTSGAAGETSSVRVLPGARNDISARLKLGTLNGGTEADAVGALRPKETPDPGQLISGAFGDTELDALPSATQNALQVALDGDVAASVSIGDAVSAGADLNAKMADVTGRLQAAVRNLKPGKPAYRDFTVSVDTANKKLVLSSGTRGRGSSVAMAAGAQNDIAGALHLLAGSSSVPADNAHLGGGSEQPYTAAEAYPLFIGDRSKREGVYALDGVDEVNLLCMPGVTDPGILADAASYCEERRLFMIVDAPQTPTKPEDAVQLATGTSLPKSDHAAVYYPWIKVADPLKNGKLRSTAPSGAIAGLYARTDASRGVWKAPAGMDASVSGAQGVDYVLTDAEHGTLNPLGVNAIRVFPVIGTVAWGARTLRGSDQLASEYKYVPIRRLALYIEESLFRGTKWVVFEPNDEPLWAQIRLNIGAFMHNLFRQGAFQGNTPAKAYFVKCDSETTIQNDIDRGIVNIVVGFAPLKPAEFVIIRIQQIAGQIQA
ncbi:MAG: phage tail sheath subtilisin-like domain-containing protein [Actinomycetota bacterium]|nr:phage tail sheath subtilisin-like domain-containing protein [Actinomycetota bacterium]